MEFTAIVNQKGEYTLKDNMILCVTSSNEQIFVVLTPEVCCSLNIPENFAASCSNSLNVSTPAACSTPRLEADPQTTPTTPNLDEGTPSEPPKTKWSVAATKNLIAVFKDKQFLFDTPLKHDRVWEIISEEMAKENFYFAPSQAKNRFYNLKRKYGQKKDGLKVTGSAPIRFDYWEEFEELFSGDHNITPICTTSNTRPHLISTERVGEELIDDDNVVIETAVRARKRPADQHIIEEIQLLREERKERWEERKALMEKQMEEGKEIVQRQINDAQEGRQLFKSLMEKLIEKL